MTEPEYVKALFARQEIIRENAARRMRKGPKLPPLPVPPKPKREPILIAYTPEGDYLGVITTEAECPDGAICKWEARRGAKRSLK